jgi:hypothetical protein
MVIVFIEAKREGPDGAEEKMFKYTFPEGGKESAAEQARLRFELEEAGAGWHLEALATMEM